MATPGRQFFDEHMQYIVNQDMVGMIKNTYAEDAILYNAFPFLDTPPPNVVKGHEQLIDVFEKYLAYQGEIEVNSLYNFLETDSLRGQKLQTGVKANFSRSRTCQDGST